MTELALSFAAGLTIGYLSSFLLFSISLPKPPSQDHLNFILRHSYYLSKYVKFLKKRIRSIKSDIRNGDHWKHI